MAGVDQRLADRVERRGVGDDDFEPLDAAAPAGRGASGVPTVQADVMVVLAGGDERRAGVTLVADAHTERVDVEIPRPGHVGGFEVDVAEVGAGGRALVAGGVVGERTEVQRERVHRHPAVVGPRPLLARAVAVDLDAVALRVAEVQRLADEVVGRAGERRTRVAGAGSGAGEHVTERAAVRHANREVEQPGLPATALGGVGVLVEDDDGRLAGREHRPRPVAFALDREADHVAVERDDAVERADAERDPTEVGVVRERAVGWGIVRHIPVFERGRENVRSNIGVTRGAACNRVAGGGKPPAETEGNRDRELTESESEGAKTETKTRRTETRTGDRVATRRSSTRRRASARGRVASRAC